MTGVVPAFFILGLLLGSMFPLAMLQAGVPGDDPFPDPNEKKPAAPSPGETLILSTRTALTENQDFPATPEAVSFALLTYAETGAEVYRERAEYLARRLRDPKDRSWSALQVIRAGGARDEDALQYQWSVNPTATLSYATAVRRRLMEASLSGDPAEIETALSAVEDFYSARSGMLAQGLTGGDEGTPEHRLTPAMVRSLEVGILTANLTGSAGVLERSLGHAAALIEQHWDAENLWFRSAPNRQDKLLNTLQAIPVLWELGFMAGDEDLKDLAARTLDRHLAEAAKNPKLATAAALAAARILRYPVQMVLIGTPGDPVLTGLRQTCFSMFEPRKVMIHLDPGRDAGRIEALMYPAELAPVLFVCVESICSAPITEPQKVEGVVASILAASRDLQE